MGGCPLGLRPAQDALQSLCPMDRQGHLGKHLPRLGLCGRNSGPSSDRLVRRESLSLRGGRKRGERTQAIGRSRGGRTTKIHALTDALCRPLAFLLTGGQVADCTAADTLLDALPQANILLGDKGYDSNAVRRKIESKGVAPNIPPKTNRRWKNCFSPVPFPRPPRNLVLASRFKVMDRGTRPISKLYGYSYNTRQETIGIFL